MSPTKANTLDKLDDKRVELYKRVTETRGAIVRIAKKLEYSHVWVSDILRGKKGQTVRTLGKVLLATKDVLIEMKAEKEEEETTANALLEELELTTI